MLGGALSGLTTHIITRLIFSTKSLTRTVISSSSVTINSNYNIRDRINAYIPESVSTTISQAADYSKKNIINPVFGQENIEKINELKNDACSNFKKNVVEKIFGGKPQQEITIETRISRPSNTVKRKLNEPTEFFRKLFVEAPVLLTLLLVQIHMLQ